jgi:hypothetical protein
MRHRGRTRRAMPMLMVRALGHTEICMSLSSCGDATTQNTKAPGVVAAPYLPDHRRARVEDLDLCALLLGIPGVFGELQAGGDRPIAAFLPRLTQVVEKVVVRPLKLPGLFLFGVRSADDQLTV